jgi:hypothetical protein
MSYTIQNNENVSLTGIKNDKKILSLAPPIPSVNRAIEPLANGDLPQPPPNSPDNKSKYSTLYYAIGENRDASDCSSPPAKRRRGDYAELRWG